MLRIILCNFLMILITNIGYAQVFENPQIIKGPYQLVSKEGDYSIQIPDNWEVMKDQMGADFIALAPLVDAKDLFRENLNVISAKFEFPITREEYYSTNLKSLNDLLTDFDLEETQDVKFGEINARKLVFTHRISVVNVKVIQYLILVDQKAIVISFTADTLDYPKIKHEFERVASSFKYGSD